MHVHLFRKHVSSRSVRIGESQVFSITNAKLCDAMIRNG